MRLTHRQFSAWVSSEGVELPCYKSELQADGRTMECWIPSAENQTFKVSWTSLRARVETRATVYFDGSQEGACSASHIGAGFPRTLSRIHVSANKARPFMFSKIDTTDDDSFADLTPSDLGTIRLSIRRVKLLGLRATPQTYSTMGCISAQTTMHEKSKKAGCHIVGMGPVERATQRGRNYKPIDSHDRPYVTFIFRYRPLDFLQAREIAPPPAPNPTTQQQGDLIEVISETDEEIRSLRERLNAAEVRKAHKRKMGASTSAGPSSKKVKIESVNHSTRFTLGEVIDLTSD